MHDHLFENRAGDLAFLPLYPTCHGVQKGIGAQPSTVILRFVLLGYVVAAVKTQVPVQSAMRLTATLPEQASRPDVQNPGFPDGN